MAMQPIKYGESMIIYQHTGLNNSGNHINFMHIGGFHAISGDTNNNGEMNKCWWTNKAS